MKKLKGKTIAVAYSGGPDAAALSARLKADGATVVPVYVRYRGQGGKTSKDLKAAKRSALLLGLPTEWIDNPVVKRITGDEKSSRNRLMLEAISHTFKDNADAIGIGTFKEVHAASGLWTEDSNVDLDPDVLSKVVAVNGHKLVTWDSYGVKSKAEQFLHLSEAARSGLFATTSCQMWWHIECGNCYSCLERHAAFLAAFGSDPTNYRPNSKVMGTPNE